MLQQQILIDYLFVQELAICMNWHLVYPYTVKIS